MKKVLFLILTLQSFSLFSQQNVGVDSIEKPKYDTSKRIEVSSINSFYFCSKLIKIPRKCDENLPENCCSFHATVSDGRMPLNKKNEFWFCSFSCYNGMTINWDYFDSLEFAKTTCDRRVNDDMKDQMKKVKRTKIKIFVLDKELDGYKLDYTKLNGYKFSEIYTYGTINGQSFMLTFNYKKDELKNEYLPESIKQILHF